MLSFLWTAWTIYLFGLLGTAVLIMGAAVYNQVSDDEVAESIKEVNRDNPGTPEVPEMSVPAFALVVGVLWPLVLVGVLLRLVRNKE